MTGSNEALGFEQWVESAVALLERAVAGDDVDAARQAFERIARAEAALGADSLASAPQAEAQRAELRRLAGADPDLMARTAANVTIPLLRHGRDGLRDALLGRSGYQVLLDLGTWPEPPLSDFHLADVDEALADAVADEPLRPDEVPDGLPASHTWWRHAG
ncbi:MAG TPA: hypothetical protein VK891_18205 [Euzebyales bacterium]|nr:hypothetical protein [Euzebyales bacterium]